MIQVRMRTGKINFTSCYTLKKLLSSKAQGKVPFSLFVKDSYIYNQKNPVLDQIELKQRNILLLTDVCQI